MFITGCGSGIGKDAAVALARRGHRVIATSAREERFFSRTEPNSTKTAVDQIVKAAEAKKPKLRYVAPWRQGAFVQLRRIFGK